MRWAGRWAATIRICFSTTTAAEISPPAPLLRRVRLATRYSIGSTTTSGNSLPSACAGASGSSAQLESFEASFNYDLNGDGTTGGRRHPAPMLIESSGSMSLLAQGSNYLLQPNNEPAVEL